MKSKILIIFFLFIKIFAYTQNINIIDTISHKPIPQVNIYKLSKKSNGTTTDIKGYFSTKNFKKGDTLKISHISYHSKIIILRYQKTIELTPIIDKIKEVQIKGKKQKTKLINNPWIIDYTVLNNNSLLSLQVSNKGNTLNLVQSRKIIFSANLKTSYNYIKKDCLGNIFLISDKYAHHITIKNNHITFNNKIELEIFNENINNCELRRKNKQYFKRYTNSNKNILFFCYDWKTEKIKTIYNSFDIKFFKFLLDLKVDINSKEIRSEFDHPMSGSRHDKDDKLLFLNYLKKEKASVNIFLVNDTVLILDNIKNQIIQFNKTENPIKYISFNPFIKKLKIKYIIQDPISEKIYYFVLEKNYINIYHLNIYTGSFNKINGLNKYIEKPSIYNNMFYYLQYNIYNETRELYKMPLN